VRGWERKGGVKKGGLDAREVTQSQPSHAGPENKGDGRGDRIGCRKFWNGRRSTGCRKRLKHWEGISK